MSRASHQNRLKANERWPALRELLCTYFGESFWMRHESFEAARKVANDELDHRGRKQILTEWWDWNAGAGAVADIRTPLAHLGVEPPFDAADDARGFMNDLYDALIVRVRSQEPGWKP